MPRAPTVGGPPSRQAHACPSCGQVYSRKEYMIRHVKSKHPSFSTMEGGAGPKKPTATPSATLRLADPAKSPSGLASWCDLTVENQQNLDLVNLINSHAMVDRTLTLGEAAQRQAGPFPPTLPLPALPSEALAGLTNIAAFNGTASPDESTLGGSIAPLLPGPPSVIATRPPLPPALNTALAALREAQVQTLATRNSSTSPEQSSLPPLPSLTPLAIALSPPVATSPPCQDPLAFLAASDFDIDSFDSSPPPRTPNFAVTAMPGTPDEWEEEIEEIERGMDFSLSGPGQLRDVSFYPESLFKEQTHRWSRGTKFFYPQQTFCVAYHYPWEVPSLPKLSVYASRAANLLLPQVPLVHAPTVFVSTMSAPLAFSLAVAGSGYAAAASKFHSTMLKEKRVFAAEHMSERNLTTDEQFAGLQSLLLYNIIGAFCDDPIQQDLSVRFHPALVELFLDLLRRWKFAPEPAIDALNLMDDDALDTTWREWVLHETNRRVSFLLFLLDAQIAKLSQSEPILPYSHLLHLVLPCSDQVWEARSPRLWRSAIRTSHAPPFFSSALDALLDPNLSPANSRTGRLLAQLSRQSSLAFNVLATTLKGLQSQLKTTNTLGPLEASDSRLNDVAVAHATAEQVISRALSLLRVVGGTNVEWCPVVTPVFV